MAKKTLFDMLVMLRKAGVGVGVDTSRAEIKLAGWGRMHLTVTHQSSGPLATALLEPDYTLRDEEAEKFEREVTAIWEGQDR